MAEGVDLKELVREAKRKGYFATEEYPGISFTRDEFRELMALLQRHNIPFGSPDAELAKELQKSISPRIARKVISVLRKGIPPAEGVSLFSIGRESLLGQFRRNLQGVNQGHSLVRFMNADVGRGKTHGLYLLREMAFREGFVVSIVTLAQDSCPLHDFMQVYHTVMWNIRTDGERKESALESVLDRWLDLMREQRREIVECIVDTLPKDLINALIAYHSATNPVRPSEDKRLLMLRYLSGERLLLCDLRRYDVQHRIEEHNALEMLGHMARLFRHLGYKGVCILFDEAESIHSFAKWQHQETAYRNLLRIIEDSRSFPHCYFLYATTPSFFSNYAYYWPHDKGIEPDDVLELNPLTGVELQQLAQRICQIYALAYGQDVSKDAQGFLQRLAPQMSEEPVGKFVRTCVAHLDEKR